MPHKGQKKGYKSRPGHPNPNRPKVKGKGKKGRY
jgi:hypothetical protein